MEAPQSFENHGRTVRAYVGALGILAANVIWSLYRLATDFSADRVFAFLVAVALVSIAFYARTFALTVQDRVIRLEMRLRLREVLPPALRPRIDELTVPQLVSLRFASDPELPELCAKVLDEKIQDRKAIKRMVKNWTGDYLRA